MRRIISVLAAAALMAVMLVAMAAPAFATGANDHNPNFNAPWAGVHLGDNLVNTYHALPADGGDPPKSNAKGGSPGLDLSSPRVQCLRHVSC